MTKYVAIKVVDAVPMQVAATPQYPSMTGHVEGADGYEVTSADASVTWIPKSVFDSEYNPETGLTFPEALHLMLQGHSVGCSNWRTYFMHVKLGTTKKTIPPLSEIADGSLAEYPTSVTDKYNAFLFDMVTEEGEIFNGWYPDWQEMQTSNWYLWTQEKADARKAEDDAALDAQQ